MDLFVSNNRVHHLVSIAYNTIVIRSIPKEKTQNRTDIWKLPIIVAFLGVFTRTDHMDYDSRDEVLQTRQVDYQYVHDVFKKSVNMSSRFITHDASFVPLHYEVKQNMMWNHSICSNSTYLLLMIFTMHNALDIRQMYRKYIKQGMIVNGKQINYVFPVSADSSQVDVIKSLREEDALYKDILVSNHLNTQANWTITVLDSYMWVRDYCKETQYVSKMDGDTWVHLGNLVKVLEDAPKKRCYMGRATTQRLGPSTYYKKRVRYSPNDYPSRVIRFNYGAGNVLSRDLIPFINIGTLYTDYVFPALEDVYIASILRLAGVFPINAGRFFLYIGARPSDTIPNAVFLHGIRPQ